MATKFVVLDQAAEMLGLTPEQLAEMRSNGEIHGYRDGKSWKFKVDEVKRVAAKLGPKTPPAADAGAERGEEASILVSEEELGHSGETTSSTIIGKAGGAAAAESDLKLKPDVGSDLTISSKADSDLRVEGTAGSDVTLIPGVGTESDVSLVPDPDSDRELAAAPGSGIDLQPASTGGTGRLEAVGSDMSIGSSDLDVSIDSELALSDDDEVVLGGSGVGSDLALGTADSGINLTSPSDSGLSLEADSGINLQSPTDSGLTAEEESLDMGGSSISSLELPEEEQKVAVEEEPTAEVKKDEEFSLAPSEDMFADEADSGSQVIALEESGAFEEAMAEAGGPALLEETAGLDERLESIEAATGLAAARMVGPGFVAAELPEAPYSIWNVMGLMTILLLLSLCGILLTDIVQNMWAWEEARDVSTGISKGITEMIFGK